MSKEIENSVRPVRLLLPWNQPSSDPRLASVLRHPAVAAVRLHGAALADATACRALTASIHAADRPDDLPLLVVLDAHDVALPDDMRPPDPQHLALDLAAGGEDFEVTLKVLTWARPVADLGIDLVLSPRLDRTRAPLDDGTIAARLASAWTEALLAAGLVACAGPWGPPPDAEDAKDVEDMKDVEDVDDAWRPFGASLAHGLESIFVTRADAAAMRELRERADELMVVGPTVSDFDQVRASVAAGVDLVPLSAELTLDEVDALVDTWIDEDVGDGKEAGNEAGNEGKSRVDALREDWLI